MTRRKNKYPGVSRMIDRHGKVRWRFRSPRVDTYLPGEYGSDEFIAAYQRFRNNKPEPVRAAAGTFDRLADDYRETTAFSNLRPITQKGQIAILRRISADYGPRSYRTMTRAAVERIMSKHASTPETANAFLKMFRRLFRFAKMDEPKLSDPTQGVSFFKASTTGFHTWTDAEIEQFMQRHPAGSLPRRAMLVFLCTGAARQDAAALTTDNFRRGRVRYSRHKTEQMVDLRIMPALAKEIAHIESGPIIPRADNGKARTPNGMGTWFREQCNAAGLPHCASHGLRKAGAKRLAEAGATSYEVMAFLGHENDQEAMTYVRAANRATLADSGFDRLESDKSGAKDD